MLTYICCRCNDGPKSQENQPQCLNCYHLTCKSCTLVKESVASGSDSRRVKSSTTLSRDKGSLEFYDSLYENLPGPPADHPNTESMAERWYTNQTDPNLIRAEPAADMIQNSEAYRHVQEAMGEIRDLDGVYVVDFHLNGVLEEWCAAEEIQTPEEMESILSLSGSGSTAFATTCFEYVHLVWGDEGWRFVQRFIEHAKQKSGRSAYSEENVKYEINCWSPELVENLRLLGKGRYILKFSTLLIWMTVILPQCSYSQCELPDILCVPEPRIRLIESDSTSLTLKYIIWGGGVPGRLKWPRTGDCWFPLFQGSFMAEGFPVPEREKDLGVEIEFDVMVTLGRVSYFLELPEGRILKGYSTILIPTTGSSPETIQWHFIQADPPDQPLSPNCIPESVRPNILRLDIEDLRSRRSFVGYCSEAHVHVGARDSGYMDVKASGAESDPPSLRFTREISPTISTSGMGIFGATFGGRVTLARALYAYVKDDEARLEERLIRSKNSPALLYDVEKGIGYLVPELNLVLQILHIWAANLPDGADRDNILQKVPFISTSVNFEDCAVKVVTESKNVVLREAYADEKTLFLITKLKEIFLAIEQRKDQRRLQNEASKRIPGLSGPFLRGWELIDIATCKPSPEKGTKLNVGPTDSWHKISRDNDDMIVFFCKGMADAIRPVAARVCPAWYPPPRNHYLLASVPCVKMLSKWNGGTRKSMRMTKKLFLCNAEDTDSFGVCDGSGNGPCSHVHSLMSKVPNREVILEDGGAILLGNSTNQKGPGTSSQARARESVSKRFQSYQRFIS